MNTQIQITFSTDDPHVEIAEKLQMQYPNHLILVQAGMFLQAFNKSAWALHVLKQYKIKLAGSPSAPHLRVGFPIADYKKRLWPLVDQQDYSYVVFTKQGFDICEAAVTSTALDAISNDIVNEVISDLINQKQLNVASTKKALTNPDTQPFIFKEKAIELDYILTQDLLGTSRDVRAIWGENVRCTMQSLMRNVYLYGNEDNKPQLIKQLSADIDLLKHYISQAKTLNRFKIAFEHRVGLVVELGRILGGLQRAQEVMP